MLFKVFFFWGARQIGTWFKRILDISVPGHFGTDLDISVLGTGQFGTWMRQFGTDHNCLVLINCQYFCTSSSLIYDSKVDRYVFLIVTV